MDMIDRTGSNHKVGYIVIRLNGDSNRLDQKMMAAIASRYHNVCIIIVVDMNDHVDQ